jgi:hydrogenase maturation protease
MGSDPTSAPDPRRPLGPVVIGLGNEARGDDACGLWVARHLRPRLAGIARAFELNGEATGLLDLWEGAGLAVVIDAMRSGLPPGTVHRIEVGRDPLPSPLPSTSTHGLSLGDAIALGTSLGRMPGQLLVYGIEASTFRPGDPMSAAVAASLEPTASRVEADVRRSLGRGAAPGEAVPSDA